jgi:transcriptional regulator with XRE-family HTH domain
MTTTDPDPPDAGNDFGLYVDVVFDQLRETLYEIAFHQEPIDSTIRDEIKGDVADLLEKAIAHRLKRRSRQVISGDGSAFAVTVGEVVARSVKRLREVADRALDGYTQQNLADGMARLGFTNWKRITVAEVESGKRKLSIEEMVGLAILFDVPVAYLLGAFETDEALVVNERLPLSAAQAQELLTGTPIEDAWFGIRLVPMRSSTAFDEFIIGSDWRPAGDLAFHVDVTEDDFGHPVIRTIVDRGRAV